LYMNKIVEEVLDANMLMFINEAARDGHTILRRHGHSGRGFRCSVWRPFIRGTCYSIIPAIMQGPVDMERFLKFLKEQVMPFTNPYPGPCSVLVMDNCCIYHGEDICCLVEDDH
ncbi:hypothetical protein PISMIDRAFT_41773, partial [Pisolithus microcarpus 441]